LADHLLTKDGRQQEHHNDGDPEQAAVAEWFGGQIYQWSLH